MDYTEKAKYHMKIIVCGTGAVGKTSIVRRFVENKFDFNYLLTVGMEPSNRKLQVNGFLVNLILFDVAGQKRFQTLREIFFRKASGALLVFDLTRPESLEELYEWKEQIDERLGKNRIPIVLLGNKADIENMIRIDYQALEDTVIPDFQPIKYLETSAYLNQNIHEAFSLITKEILKQQGILKT
ncbi:MAG: Rab family GTPase [Candidatus Hodarchaeales archaeon]|jgi:small GTP-binding protein